MSENKVYGFIGLARKAGAVAAGEALAENAVRHGRASLVIVAHDASENTKKKISGACALKQVQLLNFGDREGLGRMLGKAMYSVIAITDQGFSGRLRELIGYGLEHANSTHGGGLFEQTENS